MVKNVIFDIGNVLAEFRWKEYIKEIGIAEEKRERVALATTLSPYWNEIDRGVMTTEEIIEKCISLDPDLEADIRLFFKDRSRLVLEYPYAYDWVKSVKEKGLKIYILSNYGEENFKYISNTFRFFGLEDGRVISYQEKCIKPDEKIYRILLERYGLEASECVFLDDSEKNIETARRLGLQGIVVKSYEQAAAELEQLLGE